MRSRLGHTLRPAQACVLDSRERSGFREQLSFFFDPREGVRGGKPKFGGVSLPSGDFFLANTALTLPSLLLDTQVWGA